MSSWEQWLRRSLRFFHRMRHPRAMGKQVSVSTQNQALAALLFLYRTVLGGDVGQDCLKVEISRRCTRLIGLS